MTNTPANGAAGPDPTSEPGSAPEVVIIGAGPAGLTAAYMLTKRGVAPTVLEADDVVGGISRTAVRDGWRFDIGGHRFFTKVKPVNDLWFEILGPDEFLRRPRMSRIHYRGKLYDYPIKPLNALEEPRSGRSGALRVLVPVGARPAAEEPGHARGVRRRQLRLAALQPLLQDVQREGVGRVGVGDRGRLGRAAHQGHVAVRGGVGADPRQARRQPRQVEAGHEPHRGVQLPEVRPRPDVGEVHRARHRRTAPRWCSTPTSPRSSTPTVAPTAVTADSPRRHRTATSAPT